MTKTWLAATAAVILISGSAWAADATKPAPDFTPASTPDQDRAAPPMEKTGGEGKHHYTKYEDLTLEQARTHAHQKAEKLDKMTPEEWAQHKADVKAKHDKWNAMTPEEKAKAKAERKARHMHKDKDGAAAASDSPVTK